MAHFVSKLAGAVKPLRESSANDEIEEALSFLLFLSSRVRVASVSERAGRRFVLNKELSALIVQTYWRRFPAQSELARLRAIFIIEISILVIQMCWRMQLLKRKGNDHCSDIRQLFTMWAKPPRQSLAASGSR
jgi:IQ calmodulin-binding motif